MSAVSTEPIVVGIDGSPGAARAVDWALSWAKVVGSPVRIIASESVPPGLRLDSPGLGAKAKAVIDAETERLGDSASGVEVSLEPLVAHPVTALLDASETASAVVVGTRGSGAFQGSVIGSISGSVAAAADSPTVVLPPGASSEFSVDGPIVVGFDGSESALTAASLAAQAAGAEGRPLRLVQAETGVTSPEEPLDEVVDELRAAHEGVDIELVVVPGGAVQALTEESRDAAYLVMASQGHRGVPGFLLGSTTRALIQSAQCPVVVLTMRSEKLWPVRSR